MRTLGVRGQLAALIALAALPALLLFSYESVQHRKQAEAAAEAELGRLAKIAARQHAELVEGARLMLAAVSRIAARVSADRQQCERFFREMLEDGRGLYHGAGLYDARGAALCTSAPLSRNDVSDRRWFRSVKETGRFSIGDYQIGRSTGLPGINFGYPVRFGDALGAVAFVALDLDSFNSIAAATPLPEKGMLTVVDGEGTLLARHPEDAGRIGQKLRNPVVVEAVRSGRSTLIRAEGTDGLLRLIAVEVVAQDAYGSPGISLIVSAPLEVIHAHASRDLAVNLASLAMATLVLLAIAWYGAEHYVLRNIRALVSAAARMSEGDMSARTRLAQGSGELVEVGRAFDEMAAALQARDTELQQTLSEVQHEAATDALTGLPNRRFLDEFLPRELRRARRNGDTVAVLMLDIDHFKLFNDRFGHEAGDVLLRQIGAVLRDRIRGSDVPCRYGGEEFTLVLPGADAQGARRKAEEIRLAIQAIDAPHADRALGKVTVSQGAALFPDHAGDAASLLRAADSALYQAKAQGRNRVVLLERGSPSARGATAA